LIASQFDAVTTAAEGCDALVAGRHYAGRVFEPAVPPEVTDNRMLWDLDAQSIHQVGGGHRRVRYSCARR
jgi:hypothetical protein